MSKTFCLYGAKDFCLYGAKDFCLYGAKDFCLYSCITLRHKEKSAPFKSTSLPASSISNNCILCMFIFSKYLRTSDTKSPFSLVIEITLENAKALVMVILAIIFLF